MENTMWSKAIYILLMCAATNAVADGNNDPEELLNHYLEKYPDRVGVTLNENYTLDISLNGDSLEVFQERFEEILILTDKPQIFSKRQTSSSSFFELVEIEAFTLVPSKRKFKEVKAEDIKRSFDEDSYVFYDDNQLVSVNYPALQKGAKIILRTRHQIKDPRLLNSFYFASGLPGEKVTYTLNLDAGIETKQFFINSQKDDFLFRTADEKGRKKIVYEMQKIDPIEYYSDNLPYAYLSPGIFTRILSFKDKDGNTQTVLKSLEDLQNWYSTFTAGLDISPEVQALANEITSADDSEIDKVKSIFYWVQQNIKYIAFEQGMRGFVPHNADLVLNNRYGDCKDMSSLLVALLKAAGLDAYYTWVGTRDIPFRYTEVPSPIVDNHMIASVEIDGKLYQLDATGKYTPFPLPTSMIQGKECLVQKGSEYHTVEIPVIPKEKNSMTDTSWVKIEDGTIIGKGNLWLSGYVKAFNANRLIKTSQKSVENYLRRLLSRGSNKFILDDFDTQNVENYDMPTKVQFDFTIDDYYTSVNDDLYINLVMNDYLTDGEIVNRTNPIENEYHYVNAATVIFDIPEGYETKYVPENESYSNEFFGYEISYRQQENQLIVTKKFYVEYLIMEVDDFEEWNSGIKKYVRSCRNSVVLTKKDI
jgi:transglutaminase-like putative cysteine protease